MRVIVVLLLVSVGTARAEVRALRQATNLRAELPAPVQQPMDSKVAAAVFDPRVRDLRSIVQHRDLVPYPSKPAEKPPGQRRVSLLPMGSMAKGTGSKGVKLKIRF